MIEKGADAKNRWGESPLFYSVILGHEDHEDEEKIGRGLGLQDIVELLLTNGADVDLTNERGETPLHRAVNTGNTGIVEMLLEAGAQVNAKTNTKITPLHVAAYKGIRGIVEMLLEAGAEVNAVATKGRTPLYYAEKKGHTEIVKLLLAKGAVDEIDDSASETDSDRKYYSDSDSDSDYTPEETKLEEAPVSSRTRARTGGRSGRIGRSRKRKRELLHKELLNLQRIKELKF